MKRLFSGGLRILDALRRLFLNLFFALFLIAFVIVIFQSQDELPDEAVLLVQPQGQLVEQIKQPSAGAFPLAIPDPNQSKLWDLTRALKIARDDEHILAVKLDLHALQRTSLVKLQILRAAIEDFKQSGKPVIVSGNVYSQSQYYLAATADTIFLHPMGSIQLNGFSVYRNYIHSALAKLDIDVHVFRVGEYKSAVEPFIRDSMSDADRESNHVWLSTLWNSYKQGVASMRHMDATHLQALLDQLPKFLRQYHGDVGLLYKTEGLIDQLGDDQDAEAFLAKLLGKSEDETLPSVTCKAYLHLAVSNETEQVSKQKIGLIVASGPILNGEQAAGVIGSKTLVELLEKARMDETIKALVLRIDSPGGSALASELIRQELERLRQAGKPVIISMGSIAASGGYWIAAAGDEIWAHPTTLTGSIGVFGIVPNFSRSLNKIGVHTDGLGTTKIASSMRVDMPLSSPMAEVIQMGVDHTYQRFIHLVAAARKLPLDKVDAIAQGRVWTGIDAQRLGLVDQLGSLQDAVEAAAKRVGIADHYELKEIKYPLSLPEMLADKLFGDTAAFVQLAYKLTGSEAYAPLLHYPAIQRFLKPLQLLTELDDPNYIYAYSELP